MVPSIVINDCEDRLSTSIGETEFGRSAMDPVIRPKRASVIDGVGSKVYIRTVVEGEIVRLRYSRCFLCGSQSSLQSRRRGQWLLRVCSLAFSLAVSMYRVIIKIIHFPFP